MRLDRRAVVASALMAALAFSGCKRGPAEVKAPAGTPIILISIDTLRADHLPAYGYTGVETPAIDALRRDGILFRRAYSHTPLTLPSHASMLTGLLPGAHGVRDNIGYTLDRGRVARHELPFLPQMLKDAGYATAAGVSAFVLQGKSGLSSAFDLYEDTIEVRAGAGLGGLQRPGHETLQAVLPWLQGAAGKPFFLFLHLYEPHSPYEPPEPFKSRFASAYDGEIATADAVVGELVAELRRLGVYDRALVVLLADHGEGLGDHGEEEHGILLYTEDIHVPLLLKLPQERLAGGTAEAPAQLTDVVPTVLDLLGIAKPAALRGASLLGLLEPNAPSRRVYSETFYPRLHFGWSDLASLTDATHQLIDGPSPELYDLVKDPRETVNILSAERRTFAELRNELQTFDRTLQAPSAVDPEERAAMAALGYIGSGAGAATGPLPDPRQQLPSLAELRTGMNALHDKRYAEAAALFRRMVEHNPQMVDAWEFLGKAAHKLGRLEESIAAYQEAMRRSNGAPHIAVEIASLLFEMGRLDEAAEHARLAASTNGSFAHGLLAQIALQRNDLETAEREARLALTEKSERVMPMITLAQVLQARHRSDEALAQLARAEEAYGRRGAKDVDLIQGLNLIRGKVQAELGDADAAERSFREEMRLFPDDPHAFANLALLQALTGRAVEAGATLQQMVETIGTPAAYAAAVSTYRALRDPHGADTILAYARRKFPESQVLRHL